MSGFPELVKLEASADATLTLTDFRRFVQLELDCPWEGSTEEGFGASLSFNLHIKDAVQLRDKLTAWIEGYTE